VSGTSQSPSTLSDMGLPIGSGVVRRVLPRVVHAWRCASPLLVCFVAQLLDAPAGAAATRRSPPGRQAKRALRGLLRNGGQHWGKTAVGLPNRRLVNVSKRGGVCRWSRPALASTSFGTAWARENGLKVSDRGRGRPLAGQPSWSTSPAGARQRHPGCRTLGGQGLRGFPLARMHAALEGHCYEVKRPEVGQINRGSQHQHEGCRSTASTTKGLIAMTQTVTEDRTTATDLDVVVVGAGFGGLYAIHKLRDGNPLKP
jgi:hypothetical protein